MALDPTSTASLGAVSASLVPVSQSALEAMSATQSGPGREDPVPVLSASQINMIVSSVVQVIDLVSQSITSINTVLESGNIASAMSSLNTNLDRVADATEAISATRSGEAALDGGNPTPVVTGLTTITSVQLTLKGSSAPGLGTSLLTYAVSGGTINVYAWKPTLAIDATLIASTGTETFGWEAKGSL